MTQHQQLLQLWERGKGVFSLSQVLNTTLAREFSARISELRSYGCKIGCVRKKTSSANEYHLLAVPSTIVYKGLFSQLNKNSSDSMPTGQYQANMPCCVCGSWYRIDGRCNKGCKTITCEDFKYERV